MAGTIKGQNNGFLLLAEDWRIHSREKGRPTRQNQLEEARSPRVYVNNKATEKARMAEETSNLESDEENLQRTIKPPARLIMEDSASEGDDEMCELDTEPKKDKTITLTRPLLSTPRPLPPLPSLPKAPSFLADKSTKRKLLTSPAGHSQPKQMQLGTPPPPCAENDDISFKKNVMMKLGSLEDCQKEQLRSIRRLLMVSKGAMEEEAEDSLPKAMDNIEEMAEMTARLAIDKGYRRQLIFYLSTIGGTTVGDNIRRIMRKLGTNRLWSLYSMKGRKGKLAFGDLPLFRIIIKACMKSNDSKTSLAAIEDQISETLKHAPTQKGGPRHKVSTPSSIMATPTRVFTDSDTEPEES